MAKFSLENVLIPLFVSFFMSGLTSILEQINADDSSISTLIVTWLMSWVFAYPCLLILVPLSKKIVKSLLV